MHAARGDRDRWPWEREDRNRVRCDGIADVVGVAVAEPPLEARAPAPNTSRAESRTGVGSERRIELRDGASEGHCGVCRAIGCYSDAVLEERIPFEEADRPFDLDQIEADFIALAGCVRDPRPRSLASWSLVVHSGRDALDSLIEQLEADPTAPVAAGLVAAYPRRASRCHSWVPTQRRSSR